MPTSHCNYRSNTNVQEEDAAVSSLPQAYQLATAEADARIRRAIRCRANYGGISTNIFM